MTSKLAFSPDLVHLCEFLFSKGHTPSAMTPEILAAHFRIIFDVQCPVSQNDISRLLEILGYDEVYLMPELESRIGSAGYWAANSARLEIGIEPGRPSASRNR